MSKQSKVIRDVLTRANAAGELQPLLVQPTTIKDTTDFTTVKKWDYYKTTKTDTK